MIPPHLCIMLSPLCTFLVQHIFQQDIQRANPPLISTWQDDVTDENALNRTSRITASIWGSRALCKSERRCQLATCISHLGCRLATLPSFSRTRCSTSSTACLQTRRSCWPPTSCLPGNGGITRFPSHAISHFSATIVRQAQFCGRTIWLVYGPRSYLSNPKSAISTPIATSIRRYSARMKIN